MFFISVLSHLSSSYPSMFKHILNDEEGSRVNVAFSLNICVVYFSVRDILPTFHQKIEGWEVKLFCWFSQLYRDLKSENWYVHWGKYCDSSEMHVLDTYQHQRQPSIEYGRRAKRGRGRVEYLEYFSPSLSIASILPRLDPHWVSFKIEIFKIQRES